MKELRGKVALVTGTSRGVGVFIAEALAREGMNLVLAARNAEGLEEVKRKVEALGVKAVTVAVDLADPAAPELLIRKAEEAFGDIDVLVNNAGMEDIGAVEKIDPKSIEECVAVNLTAPMLLCRLVLPKMLARNHGSIVNIASLSGMGPNAYSEVYAATKHGVVGFTSSLRATADAEGGSGVGVTSICPGFISTTGMSERMRVDYQAIPPALLGVSPPEDVATAVIRAIRKGEPNLIVNPGPTRIMLAMVLLFPSFGEWFARAFNVHVPFKVSAVARGKAREALRPAK